MDNLKTDELIADLKNLQKYQGKIIVVKYGGNAMINEELKQQVMQDIALLAKSGIQMVLVHGGGPDINLMMDKVGKVPEFVDGLRVTDQETIEIVQMVLAGKVNKSLVNMLGAEGARAVGISGIDAQMLVAEIKDKRLGYVGKVTGTDPQLIYDLLEKGYIPVISTIACDEKGNAYNINGDTAAAKIAGALHAERLIMMTDIAGVMRDFKDPDTLISSLTVSQAAELKREGIISGGMIPKVECCVTALKAGVHYVKIADGRVPHCLLKELIQDGISGTEFSEDEE